MPNNQQNPDVLKLVRDARNFAGNGWLLNWLSRHAFLGNLLLLLLVGYSGKNLWETFTPQEPDPNFISKEEVCNQLKDSNQEGFEELFIGGQSTEASIQELNRDGLPFGCRYELQGNKTLNVRVQLKTLREDLLPSYGKEADYRDNRISKDELDKLCSRPNFYAEKVQNEIDSPADTYTVIPQGVILSEDMRVWPVFRWKCSYLVEYENPAQENQNTPVNYPLKIGMTLSEEYCHVEYSKIHSAFYHDYNDPYSWYCTIPNRDAKRL